MKTTQKLLSLACAATISLSSLCMTTEALGGETLTSAVTSIVSLDASFTSKKVTLKSDYTCTTSAVRLNWDKVSGASGYRIYKYDSSAKKWVKVKTVKGGSTTTARITGLSAGSKYRFKVKAYKHYNGKTYWSKASTQKYIATKPKQVTIATEYTNAGYDGVCLEWQEVKCDGYKIYQKINGKYKLIATIKNSDYSTNYIINYTIGELSENTKYTFKIRPYRKDTVGKVVYGKGTVYKIKTGYQDPLSGVSKSSSNKNKVSAADQKILKKFADKHFKDDWSDSEKLGYTFKWIRDNYTYATGSNWTKISGLSYVDAIFNYKLGQCAQYNGAMVAMFNYLGYEAKLAYTPGHYWCEVESDGKTYIIDIADNSYFRLKG